ncbi:TRAP transporter substrate-binding protein [Anianabacter salinae]|uniref:TRAP transporter substrate-binding protein n=1 Tax=Anianabacter salinae TaxID=2851023 RepID=UPI00225E4100|nr:TRAP transporter substrate-binding protein [Anianabacter salinae]MBV0911682.1 TRAP transporter substrate-binding protein DctP [Anianabacter salinae]
MKRRDFLKTGAAGAATVGIVGISPAFGQNASLRISTWVPPTHHMTANTLPTWIAAVDEASGGAIKLSIDPAPIAGPPAQYDLVRDGAADIAYHVAAYTPGPFEVARGVENPFLSPNAEIGSQAVYDWYDRNIGLDAEFSDVKVLTMFVHGPGNIHSTMPINTVEDMAGVKLRVGGGGVRMCEALGGAPVAMPANQAYEAIQKGVADGAMFPWEAIKGFRLGELVNHHLEVPGGLYTTVFAVIMNRAKYDALSDENKQVLEDLGGVAGAKIFGKGWDDADAAGKQVAIDNGATISTLSDEQLAIWRERVAFMNDDWIALANEQGQDGAALLDDLRATIAKYASA